MKGTAYLSQETLVYHVILREEDYSVTHCLDYNTGASEYFIFDDDGNTVQDEQLRNELIDLLPTDGV